VANATSLMPMLVFQPLQINASGQAVPIPGGKLWSYAAGTNVPQALYSDSTGATPLTNPVILNASGIAQIYLSTLPYKFLLTDANDVTIFPYPIDNVSSGAASILDTPMYNEVIIATAGQTLFNLSNAYVTGINTIAIYQNGAKLCPADYTETSSTSITLTIGATAGDCLQFVSQNITNASAIADVNVQVQVGATSRNQHDKNADIATPEDYGAIGDGITNDYAAFAAAKTALAGTGRVLRGVKNYRIKSTLDLRGIALDFAGSTITMEGSTVMLKIGGTAADTPNPPQNIYKVLKLGGATATPTCRIMGTKDQTITIGYCDYLQVYADTDNASDSSVAYCTWFFGYIQHLEFATNPAPVGSTVQWINENHCYFQRCGKLTFGGTYEHNHNHFYGGTFEGANPTTAITLNRGWDNQFHDCRFEIGGGDTVTITLASNTQRNVFINTYDASEGAYDETGVILADSGVDNLVIDDWALYRHSETVAYTDLNEVVLDTQLGEFIARTTDLQRIYNTDNFGMMCQSDFVPVSAGDYFTWISQAADGSLGKDAECAYRPRISFYNAYLGPVTANANFFVAKGSGFTSISSNNATQGSNISGGAMVLTAAAISAGVRFVKVAWRNAISPVTATSKAVMLAVVHHTAESRPYQGVASRVKNPVAGGGMVVTGQPTKGFAPVGWVCIKSDGSARYFNKYMHQTSTLNAETAGATVIEIPETVNGAGLSIANGDIVGVNLDDLTTHWTTVASFVAATSVTLTASLPSGAAAGKRVVFGRWAAC